MISIVLIAFDATKIRRIKLALHTGNINTTKNMGKNSEKGLAFDAFCRPPIPPLSDYLTKSI